jgi:hypothetical protein
VVDFAVYPDNAVYEMAGFTRTNILLTFGEDNEPRQHSLFYRCFGILNFSEL